MISLKVSVTLSILKKLSVARTSWTSNSSRASTHFSGFFVHPARTQGDRQKLARPLSMSHLENSTDTSWRVHLPIWRTQNGRHELACPLKVSFLKNSRWPTWVGAFIEGVSPQELSATDSSWRVHWRCPIWRTQNGRHDLARPLKVSFLKNSRWPNVFRLVRIALYNSTKSSHKNIFL